MESPIEIPLVSPQVTLLSGRSFLLPLCRNVLDIKVFVADQFPGALPPEFIVLHDYQGCAETNQTFDVFFSYRQPFH